MHLLVVLQTHSKADSQQYQGKRRADERRFTGATKAETAKRCVRSLIRSLNHCTRNAPNVRISLKIFDDHSDEEYLITLKRDLEKALFPVECTPLTDTGILASIDACYTYGKEHGRDIVYFAQDDYLYEESALLEMVVMFLDASEKLGNYVAIYPYNDPYRYRPENIVPVRIVQSDKRHWRTSFQTASCFMLHHAMLIKEYDLFDALVHHPLDPKMEDDTINKLFQERGYFLFTPIPSLAFHMQYETERDPFVDYLPLWNTYADPEPEEKNYNALFEGDAKILLNIGAGQGSIKVPLLEHYKEVRLDMDEAAHPDIVSSITDMSAVPSRSVDLLWASHIIEHVFWHELPAVFAEIKRVLKAEGSALLIVPNLGALDGYMKEQIDTPLYDTSAGPIAALDMIYGYRGFTAHGMVGMMHKIGFNAALLHKALLHSDIKNRIYEGDFEIIAVIGDPPQLDDILRCMHGDNIKSVH